MAKDPRFNFYVDNWIGGTEGFTLEQEGAYLSLIIMQSKMGRFTKEQALDKLLQKTRGNTAVSTALFNFLIPKFETDGSLLWSARLEKELEKSKKHSELQRERVNKRYGKDSGTTAVVPDNRIGNGNRIGIEKGVQGERENSDQPTFQDYERWTEDIITGNDHLFTNMLRKLPVKPNGHLPELARSHLALLAKYPKMQPADQTRFRTSALSHIEKEMKHERTQGTPQRTTSATSFSGDYSGKL